MNLTGLLEKAYTKLIKILIKILPGNNLDKGEMLARILKDELLVDVIRARSNENDSVVYAHHVFSEISFLFGKYSPHRPASVLEIGPGVNLGVLFCFLASGIEKAAATDIAHIGQMPISFYRILQDYLACVEGFVWWRYFTEKRFPHISFPPREKVPVPEELLKRIDYRCQESPAHLPFEDNSFDLVYSVSALEHVPDPAKMVDEITRILRNGGFSIHEIGLQHHGSIDPLKFLEWPEEEYLSKAQTYGNGRTLQNILDGTWTGEVYCNRLRLSDWLELFNNRHLTILEVEKTVLIDQIAIKPERFIEPFSSKSLEDLSVLGFRIVAKCNK